MSSLNPYMIPVVLTQSTINGFGLVMNLFFVFVVLRNKPLRGNACGMFLLILAITDSLSELALLFLPPITYISNTTIPLGWCFFAELFNPYADAIGYNVIMFISFDRLIGIIFPIRYQTISTKYKEIEVFICVLLGAIYSTHNAVYYFLENVGPNMGLQVYCLPSDFMKGKSLEFFNNSVVIIFVVACINYAILFFLIRRKGFAEKRTETEKRISKSIFILMANIFGCLLPVPILRAYLLPILPVSSSTNYLLGRILLLLWKIAPALQVPALYFSSSDYRTAMQKEMRKIIRKIRGKNGPTTVFGITTVMAKPSKIEMNKKNGPDVVKQMINRQIMVNNFVSHP